MGFTHISEDSSEIAFLLVENYNHDRFTWSSDRVGIFGPVLISICLFVDSCTLCGRSRKRFYSLLVFEVGVLHPVYTQILMSLSK